MKRYIQDYFMLLVPVGLIILLDQWTKSWVRSNIAFGESWGPEWLAPFARFVHWYNTGAAFGLFQGMGTVFIILAFVISIAILIYYPRVPRQDWTLRLAMSLQMAGALGNLIDRLTIGHVTDFIAIGSFPVWNIADASITVG
ncbi:MAG TPA: signal peptidase II, partial [Anaerolineaceae bacterium]|nr:signal peptidase II [Anaerolineaceae bacterium]